MEVYVALPQQNYRRLWRSGSFEIVIKVEVCRQRLSGNSNLGKQHVNLEDGNRKFACAHRLQFLFEAECRIFISRP